MEGVVYLILIKQNEKDWVLSNHMGLLHFQFMTIPFVDGELNDHLPKQILLCNC